MIPALMGQPVKSCWNRLSTKKVQKVWLAKHLRFVFLQQGKPQGMCRQVSQQLLQRTWVRREAQRLKAIRSISQHQIIIAKEKRMDRVCLLKLWIIVLILRLRATRGASQRKKECLREGKQRIAHTRAAVKELKNNIFQCIPRPIIIIKMGQHSC